MKSDHQCCFPYCRGVSALFRSSYELPFYFQKSPKHPNAIYFCQVCSNHIDSIAISYKHMNNKRHKKEKKMKQRVGQRSLVIVQLVRFVAITFDFSFFEWTIDSVNWSEMKLSFCFLSDNLSRPRLRGSMKISLP